MHRTLRHAAAAAAVLLMGSALLAGPAVANASETELSGTVTDDLGAAVATCVQVYDPSGSWVDSACTDDSGRWALTLPEGEYRVYVQGTGYHRGEWHDDAADFEAATVVSAPGAITTTLEVAGLLEGTLTDSEGAPVPWTAVAVLTASGEYVAGAHTNDVGDWSALVDPGDYLVHFTDYAVDQWAFGAPDQESASVVTVQSGRTTRVDDRLAAVTTVSGVVTDEGGRPLENVCAHLVNPDAFSPNESFGYGCSDSEGRYQVVPYGEATSATVWFQDTSEVPVYAPEFAGGSYEPDEAQRLDLSSGDLVVDATLAVGGVITGKAVTERRPNGLADVCPTAHAGRAGGFRWGVGSTCSGADGIYRLTALPPGDTAVLLQPSWRSGVADEWYQDADTQATATLAAVSLGATTSLRPNKFVPGGVVTGTVTDTSGQPVEGAWVYLEGRYPGRAGPGEGRFVAQTDAAGRYHLIAPAGTYTPLVDPPWEAGLAPQWSGGAVTRASATPVTVRDYRTTTSDATLVPASRISGTVVTADGSVPSADLYIAGYVFTETGDYIGDLDAWADNGFRFVGSNLPSGAFRVQAEVIDVNTGESATVWFDGATTEAGATLVPVGPGGTTEITFHLP